MKDNAAYHAFMRENYLRTNTLLNKICWFNLLTGPLIALFIYLGITQRTHYGPCYIAFFVSLMVAILHTLLLRHKPEGKHTAILGLFSIQLLVVVMWMVSIRINLTWFVVPVCSLLYCSRKIFALAAAFSYLCMLLACWLERVPRSQLFIHPSPLKWFSDTIGAYTIEYCFMLAVGFAVCRLLETQMEKLYGNKLTISRQQMENNIDLLTGLWNRRYLVEQLDTMPAERKIGGCLLVIDLDNFKSINDTYGHLTGDRALSMFGGYLKGLSQLLPGTIAARFGGDEFLLFIPDVGNDHNLHRRLAQGKKEVEALFSNDPQLKSLSASLGAVLIEENQTFEELFTQADEALLRLKQRGKNGYLVA